MFDADESSFSSVQGGFEVMDNNNDENKQGGGNLQPPLTPAYPAFPPNTPGFGTASAGSLFGQQQQQQQQQQSGGNSLAPSVEIRRDRGMMMTPSGPQTPGPTMMGGGFGELMNRGVVEVGGGGGGGRGNGEPIIVSVGLVQPKGKKKRRELYPLDQFLLDIFVFNKSGWTRRFEVSVPDERRRRKLEEGSGNGKKSRVGGGGGGEGPGIIPLENRIRIG
jgi:hypothetical protein